MRGRALFFINLPASIIELGLEDQEIHTYNTSTMAAVVFQICEDAESARVFLRDTFFCRHLNQGQIRGYNIAFNWGCAHSSPEGKGLVGIHLTDAPDRQGTWHWPSGDKDKKGVDIPDLLRFLKLLCGWWRENGSSYGVI